MSTGWNSFCTDEPLGITAGITTIPGVDGRELQAYVARPTTPGRHPGVLVFHHVPGWDEFYFEFAERLARHGYIVILPNLFESYGHGTPDQIAAKVREAGGVHDDSAMADGEAALRWLQSQPDYNGNAGVTGGCSGGRHALLIGSTRPGFAAIADLWGGAVTGNETEARPIAPVKFTEQLTIPLLGLFGNDDRFPPADQVDQHEAELKKHGKDYEFHRYDDTGHAFFVYSSPNYHQGSAMDGWGKLLDFFGRHLWA